MNDQQLETKIKKDLSTLAGDSAARFGRFGDDVSQVTGKAKVDLTTWVGDGVSQLGEKFEKLTGDAKETVVGATATVKKEVGHGLSRYNSKLQEVVDKVPGGFSEKTAKYPWVALSIALVVGFLLGSLLKPARLLLS